MSSMRQSGSMIIDDITGNITHLPDSVILNIETSTGSSSSESQIGDDESEERDVIEEAEEEEEEEEDDDDGNDGDLQHDNWEVQMLAAELSRRESKREEPLSSETTSEADDNLGSTSGRQRLQQMRSDTLDTDTENSELEPDQRVQRPRAASFDHQSVPRQRAKGILKALSFDRDKDRL